MKSVFILIVLSVTMPMIANGQEVINEWQQHRHSLDVSTGYPSVCCFPLI